MRPNSRSTQRIGLCVGEYATDMTKDDLKDFRFELGRELDERVVQVGNPNRLEGMVLTHDTFHDG